MASITELVNSFDVDSEELEWLIQEIMVNNDVPFYKDEVDRLQNIIIANINSRINQENTRYHGLRMLDRILHRCSKDLFSKYGLLWIAKATQILENARSNTQEITLACKVLGSLIEHCKEITDLHKQISMQNVKQLLNVLDALKTDAKCGAVYYLTAVLLYHYPQVCERFQELIKKMILLQIDSTQENLVNASAKCYVLLSKATERSFNPPPTKSTYTAWLYNEALLCNNLHTIMDTLFSELLELESVVVWDQLALPTILEQDNTIQYYNKQKQRFSNLCTYLSSMLRGYEAKNTVLPDAIIRVLCRGLAITPLNIKNKTFKGQMLYMILPKMHISLLTVLDAFINGFAQELIPFGGTILNLFQQTLQWTSTILENQITFGNSKPFKNVKICLYKCLSSWLKNTKSLSGIETITNKDITFILKDITPEEDRILLSVQQNTQHLSKRAAKRLKNSQYENSSVLNNGEAVTKNEHLDADVCREAAIVLQNILFSGSVLLKLTFYKNVQNTIIPLLYNHYLGSSGQNFYKQHNKCRLELFKVLKALQMNPQATLAFPTQYSLEISHMAANDIDLNIAYEAKLTLAELEKIIHPVAPTLQLPRQQKPDDQFVSEKQEEEVATISELDKKSRVEEELSQDTNIMSTCKRPKIISIERVKIMENASSTEQNCLERIEANNSVMDVDKSQVDKNSFQNV
ncbi:proline-, glutamic acid- and leucine-rich protein 1 [Linepithema humile]|uniref:proline-, glutamic acid- and leucine-rich protein 1 n=1 Tax=Linepithema humile TaxID=83485 RepID=UPI00351F6801